MLLLLLFWGVILAPLFLVCYLASIVDDSGEYHSNDGPIFFGALTCVVALIVWWWIGVISIPWISSHPFEIIIGVVSYVVIGVVWALIKWLTLCKDKLKEFNAKKDKIEKDWAEKPEVTKSGTTYVQYVKEAYKFPPSPSDYPGRITTWLMWWWASMVATFFGDYIARFFRWVYDKLSHVLSNISNHVFKDTGLTS